MRITRLQLKNFKRFTDISIDAIPKEAKLVLLIGSNGSGKSSIFDAFNSLAKNPNFPRLQIEDYYYSKNNVLPEIHIQFDNGSIINTNPNAPHSIPFKFIGRSSIR